jgi:hypothetical protein
LTTGGHLTVRHCSTVKRLLWVWIVIWLLAVGCWAVKWLLWVIIVVWPLKLTWRPIIRVQIIICVLRTCPTQKFNFALSGHWILQYSVPEYSSTRVLSIILFLWDECVEVLLKYCWSHVSCKKSKKEGERVALY